MTLCYLRLCYAMLYIYSMILCYVVLRCVFQPLGARRPRCSRLRAGGGPQMEPSTHRRAHAPTSRRTYISLSLYLSLSLYIYIHIHTCVYICICICICMYVCIIYIYIYIYTYIHTCTYSPAAGPRGAPHEPGRGRRVPTAIKHTNNETIQ